MTEDFDSNLIRNTNKRIIADNPQYKEVISELHKIEHFISNLGFLSFGQTFICCGSYVFSLQKVMASVELTIGSIISCCESACVADANTLLRKYRDDLFFYLYVSVYNSICNLEKDEAKQSRMQKQISNWLENSMSELHIGDVMREIGTSPEIKEAVKKYKLQSFFCDLGKRLNNFVHSNGYEYYNLSVSIYTEDDLLKELKRLLDDTRFITVTFLFLLVLCSPLSVMSTDYIDYLEFKEIPPKGSQYWVAPFVENFFVKNIDLINENCMDYLRENTIMQFKGEGDMERE